MAEHARILAMIEDLDGCALWRVLMPISELQRQGYRDIEWDSHKNPLVSYLFHQAWWQRHQYDAVILPRKHWASKDQWMAARWFDTLHDAGLAVIYELDDDLFSPDFERRLIFEKDYSAAEAKEKRGNILDTIRQCDGMTVSCQRLATMARQYVDIPVKVVPNYIDLHWFKSIQKANQRDQRLTGTTIGWAGGNRPDADIEPMVKAWRRIAEKYPHIIFVIQGHHSKLFYELLPEDRIAMIDWLPIDGYPAGLLNIDIGCCPLADTTFNRAKTYIKALEYAASSAAVLAAQRFTVKLLITE